MTLHHEVEEAEAGYEEEKLGKKKRSNESWTWLKRPFAVQSFYSINSTSTINFQFLKSISCQLPDNSSLVGSKQYGSQTRKIWVGFSALRLFESFFESFFHSFFEWLDVEGADADLLSLFSVCLLLPLLDVATTNTLWFAIFATNLDTITSLLWPIHSLVDDPFIFRNRDLKDSIPFQAIIVLQ